MGKSAMKITMLEYRLKKLKQRDEKILKLMGDYDVVFTWNELRTMLEEEG